MASALKNSIARLGSKLDEHKKDAVPARVGLASLVAYPRQARTSFPEESLRELAESIKEFGVLEPLLVRPLGGNRFEIVAGERRWRAAQMVGLAEVPVLSKAMDDTVADRVHLAENVHRENLSTLDLAQRVKSDLDVAGGDLAVVAARFNKQKPWVSKLLAVAQGGDAMTSLVEEGVTADRAVLATVSSLERKSPERAEALGAQLRAASERTNKRAIAERFMKAERSAAKKPASGTGSKPSTRTADGPATDSGRSGEPGWRLAAGVGRDAGQAVILVELSPHSELTDEFRRLSKTSGEPRLATAVRHPDASFVIVEFGEADGVRRAYRADELRLVSVA